MNFRQTFKKEERIFLQKEIDFLFAEGNSFCFYPLRVIYAEKKSVSEAPVSILVSVPKKRIKLAVKRNRLKRLIREAYRRNKTSLWEAVEGKKTGMLIAFIFVGNELIAYDKIENALLKSLQVLKEKAVV